MAIDRVSDRQTFVLLNERVGTLQAQLATLRDRVATGKAHQTPDEDPIGAATTVRVQSSIGALGAYKDSVQFGNSVLGAQFSTLQQAKNLMTRAAEIATQQSTSLRTDAQRQAAAEEVHGILQAMTALGNTTYAGRRLYSWLAQDGTPPFADPDTPGYDASTAYTGATQSFEVKTGDTAQERVRVTTPGDQVFTASLQGLQALETALRTNGDVAGTATALQAGEDVLSSEAASVGGRQSALQDRLTQITSLTGQEQAVLTKVSEADLISTVSELSQVQTSLQALLQAAGQIFQTDLSSVIRF